MFLVIVPPVWFSAFFRVRVLVVAFVLLFRLIVPAAWFRSPFTVKVGANKILPEPVEVIERSPCTVVSPAILASATVWPAEPLPGADQAFGGRKLLAEAFGVRSR